MISTFRAILAASRLVRRGDSLLLAVSGGSDSVGLFHLFRSVSTEFGLKIALAHFNHRLRGRASDGDARFVEELAHAYDLPCFLGASEQRPVRGLSKQENARRERLSFLLGTARRRTCRVVALGHTADDQAETVLMRFLHEGGPAGLGGIPPASHGGRIIHPLLSMRKSDIRSWLNETGAAWREDRSNQSVVYVRNRIRLELLPHLKEAYNPRLVDRLAEIASLLRRDNDFLESLARQVMTGVQRSDGKSFFPSALMEKTHPSLLSRALLAEIRSLAPGEVALSSRHLETLLGMRTGKGFSACDLPGGIMAGRDHRGLLLLGPGRPPDRPPPFRTPLSMPGTALFHGGTARVTSWQRRIPPRFSPAAVPGAPWRAVLDGDSVVPPLVVRNRKDGDRVRLLGAPGSRKLKEIMIDAGIPRLLRNRLPVICDTEGIIWVAGLRPAHRCRVRKGTSRLLFLEARGDYRAGF